jgi:hypothetical protein
MNTTTLGRPPAAPPRWLSGRSALDWVFAAVAMLGTAYAFTRYGGSMDGYEKAILLGTVPAVVALGWFWGPLRIFMLGVGGAVLAAVALYSRATDGFGADLARAENVFLLKYLLASQSAILWMSVLFFMSTLFYWLGFAARSADNAATRIGSGLAWAAAAMALIGTGVRWYESHQIGPDIGHIPVSNLYEVFILFCWMTALFYLYYEQHYKTRALGAFVMLIVSAAVGFLLWYTVARDAQEIQPLVPALQSWWMKVHVPANFIGYGSFSLSHGRVCLPGEAARGADELAQARAAVPPRRRPLPRTDGLSQERHRQPQRLLGPVLRRVRPHRRRHHRRPSPHRRASAVVRSAR